MRVRERLQEAISRVSEVVRGKDEVIRLSFCCLLAKGHLLLEDLPGTGKTTLAMAMARVMGCSFARIQFTSDLLPADVLGTLIYHPAEGRFVFRRGPIFHHLILADEINRASPKAQSALLEAMGEGQVSVEGVIEPLPQPFFVIATQNPHEFYGTFPLPESQLDRFTMSLEMGYPPRDVEKEILERDVQGELKEVKAVLGPQEILEMQRDVHRVFLHEDVNEHVMKLTERTRTSRELRYGVSTRAAQAIVACAKAWAFIEGRDYVIPEDVGRVFIPVVIHRLGFRQEMERGSREAFLKEMLKGVPFPD